MPNIYLTASNGLVVRFPIRAKLLSLVTLSSVSEKGGPPVELPSLWGTGGGEEDGRLLTHPEKCRID